jgi:predicted site-specific integrase-resolvase
MKLTDVGSGLDPNRKGLQKLLALVQDYRMSEIVVAFSDRLTRFGLGYLSTRFFGYGLQLTVLEPAEEKTPEQELTKDLLALIASLAGQLYGLRSRKRRELLACAEHGLSNP